MLQYNFSRMFIAKGVDKVFTFLTEAGFSKEFATKIKNNRTKRLSVDMLERLCLALNCTPNDVMEWHPTPDTNVNDKHALYQLKRMDKVMDISKTITTLPLEKLKELERVINSE